MSARPIVDSVDFARRREELRGEVTVADLERLREALFDTQGAVEFTLNGLIDADGKPNLWLELQAEVHLTCKRCLGSLTLPVDVRKRFVLTRPDEDPGDMSDEALDVEHIPADASLDVISLIEDELLLGLPMSAAHETGQCAPDAWDTGVAEADSPFVSLAGLKQAPGTEN